MIDKQQFNDFFQYFEKELVIEIIDFNKKQILEIIYDTERSIEEYDLGNLRWKTEMIKDSIKYMNFRETDAFLLSKALDYKLRSIIDQIINIFLIEFPDSLRKLTLDNNVKIWNTVGPHTLNEYLTGLIGPLSEQDRLKLETMQKQAIENGIPLMFSEMKVATTLLLEELQIMRQELMAG